MKTIGGTLARSAAAMFESLDTNAETRLNGGVLISSVVEKGAAGFEGITLLLCENPLPPLPAAIESAERELSQSNH